MEAVSIAMPSKTLSFRLAILIASLLLATTIALLASMWLAISDHANNQVDANLDVGVNIFEEVRSSKQIQLLNTAEVLTADFGFRQAVASNDVGTIESALINQANRINADMMAITSLEGEIISTTLPEISSRSMVVSPSIVQQILAEGIASSMTTIDGTIYQVVWTTVDAPIPIAVAALGFAMDLNLARELQQITNLDISFVDNATSVMLPRVSTLQDDDYPLLAASTQDEIMTWHSPFDSYPHYKSRLHTLYQGDNTLIQAYLTDDINRVFSEFAPLQLQVGSIAALAISIALVMGVLFSRGLTRPLFQLIAIARDIAKGNYERRLEIASSTQEINELASAVSSMQEDIREREDRISYQATHDTLTGLFNRSLLTEFISEKIEQQKEFHLIAVNAANLRATNDTFGHAIGDECLKKIGERLNHFYTLNAHLGSGHFISISEGPLEDTAIELLQKELVLPYEVSKVQISLQINIGVVSFPYQADNTEDLIRRLEIAADYAHQSSNGIQYYRDGQEEEYILRLQLADELRQELAAEESTMQMYYQPKLNLPTGKVTRMEALIRWIHPDRGFISPELFIPLAEQSGLINRLTEWVIIQVIKQIAEWNVQHVRFQVAINLSAQDIARPELLDFIDLNRKQYSVDTDQLAFEITESELMADPKHAIVLLTRFRDAGFDLAIDDFGTGYSSLSQLKLMPVSELKIDREFVMQLAREKDDQTIVKSTIDLAHSFNLKIVAEGVEDEASLALLKAWGCEWMQGYWLARPMPGHELLPWLEALELPEELTAS